MWIIGQNILRLEFTSSWLPNSIQISKYNLEAFKSKFQTIIRFNNPQWRTLSSKSSKNIYQTPFKIQTNEFGWNGKTFSNEQLKAIQILKKFIS